MKQVRLFYYFHEQINQIKSCSKKLSKYVAAFDYIENVLIVLSVTTGGISICSFTSIAGAPVRIASASFFFTNNRNYQKITEDNKENKEKA